MTFWQILQSGGITMYFLLSLSVFSLAVIIERFVLYMHCVRISPEKLMAMVRPEILRKSYAQARDMALDVDTPSARVVAVGLAARGAESTFIENAMDRQITTETMRLEKRVGIVGTIGSTAVYIGLFGTVLGIINAFQQIANKGSGGVPVVINGIAEALVCTAVGLCVAVPAVVAYNFFIKKIDDQIKVMEMCASETLDLLGGKAS